jgi:hypothetical protein
MLQNFWVVGVYFNPAKYKSLIRNYIVFANALKRQNINLMTVELAFGDSDFDLPEIHGDFRRLRSNSIMWQKERLINYGVSQLPSNCDKFAWIDCDVLLPDDWELKADKMLDKVDIIQLFKKVVHLPPNQFEFINQKVSNLQGIVWQQKIHKNWLARRKNKELPFSAPGFAWAAKRSVFEDIGIYDKNIVGSGDTFLVDCYLGSWDIHGYAIKFTDAMKKDMSLWKNDLDKKNVSLDYLPIDVYHLFHGSMKNRKYMDRHETILKNNYDPVGDIKLIDGVFEWNSDKYSMHEDVKGYFFGRNEDEFYNEV